MITLKVKHSSVAACRPLFAHNDDRNAGADIFAAEKKILWPKSKCIINTKLSLEQIITPEYPSQTPKWFKTFIVNNFKCGAIIKSRSGLSVKYSIEHGAGVIDEGYRGELKIILHNHGWLPKVIHTGDRVAQIICHLLPVTKIVRSKELSDSERGEKGFGSSGTK